MARFALFPLVPLLSRSFAALVAVTALASASSLTTGCNYSRHQAGYSNGENDQLYFLSDSGSSSTAIAVGTTFTVTVKRVSAQDVSCNGLGLRSTAPATGGTHIQGGSINTEQCNGLAADAVKFVSASCEDDVCSIDAETTNDRLITLHVTGKRAAETRLLVSLTSEDGATKYDDATKLSFGVSSRIRVKMADADLPVAKNPVLTGVSIDVPASVIVDEKDRPLFTGSDPPVAAYEGDAFVEATDRLGLLVATRPGHTVLHWRYAGVPDRTLDLEVVDPAQARALFVYAALPEVAAGTLPPKPSDPDDLREDSSTSGGRITSLELDSAYRSKAFPTRVSLADGRLAIANLDSVDLLPYDLAYAAAAYGDASLLEVRGQRAGEGMLTLRAAPGATLTLPVKVTAPPPKGK